MRCTVRIRAGRRHRGSPWLTPDVATAAQGRYLMCRAAFDGTIGTWTPRPKRSRADRRIEFARSLDRSDAVRCVRRCCPAIRRRCLRRAHRSVAADAHRRRGCRPLHRGVGAQPVTGRGPRHRSRSSPAWCRRGRLRPLLRDWRVVDDGAQHRPVAGRRHHDPGNRRRRSAPACCGIEDAMRIRKPIRSSGCCRAGTRRCGRSAASPWRSPASLRWLPVVCAWRNCLPRSPRLPWPWPVPRCWSARTSAG